MPSIRCIGISTGGGDAPGLNAVIRAAVKSAILKHNWKVIGIPDGFDGLIFPGSCSRRLTLQSVSGSAPRRHHLGTANRGHPFEYCRARVRVEVERPISPTQSSRMRNCKGSTPSSPLAATARQKIAPAPSQQGH